jgi:peptidoglycan/LPS O-acetylase OafA/YrhL
MNKNYMIQLDGFRFIAVFLVMFGHWVDLPVLSKVNWYLASAGVNLFFVLSGFLITQILINNKGKSTKRHVLKQFYIRRFLRIFPLYYLVIFLGYIFAVPFARGQFIYMAAYMVNILAAVANGHVGQFLHLWSLAVEEQFYITFPFIVLFLPKRRLMEAFYFIIALAVASRIAIAFIPGEGKAEFYGYILTPTCFDCFGIGAILAYLKVNKEKRLKWWLSRRAFFFGALILSISLFFISHATGIGWLRIVPTRFLFSIFAFWLIGKASFNKFHGWFLENRIIVYLGRITYGLYVYHYFMPYLFERIFHVKGMQYAPLYFLTTIAIAALSWHFFESPINNLKERFTYRRRQRLASADILSKSDARHQT